MNDHGERSHGRKRALLSHEAGPEVHEIFKTLPDIGDDKDHDKAVQALTKHFEPKKNRTYQTYMFRQATQQDVIFYRVSQKKRNPHKLIMQSLKILFTVM